MVSNHMRNNFEIKKPILILNFRMVSKNEYSHTVLTRMHSIFLCKHMQFFSKCIRTRTCMRKACMEMPQPCIHVQRCKLVTSNRILTLKQKLGNFFIHYWIRHLIFQRNMNFNELTYYWPCNVLLLSKFSRKKNEKR